MATFEVIFSKNTSFFGVPFLSASVDRDKILILFLKSILFTPLFFITHFTLTVSSFGLEGMGARSRSVVSCSFV